MVSDSWSGAVSIWAYRGRGAILFWGALPDHADELFLAGRFTAKGKFAHFGKFDTRAIHSQKMDVAFQRGNCRRGALENIGYVLPVTQFRPARGRKNRSTASLLNRASDETHCTGITAKLGRLLSRRKFRAIRPGGNCDQRRLLAIGNSGSRNESWELGIEDWASAKWESAVSNRHLRVGPQEIGKPATGNRQG
jgi:hypothetical protein